MEERQRLFKIHGEHGSYEGLIRLQMTFEGAVTMDAIVDVTAEKTGKKRVLNMRNDRAKRLDEKDLPEYQAAIIEECMTQLRENESWLYESVEVHKIGARCTVNHIDFINSKIGETDE